jgi:DNA polymerase-1
MLIYRCCCAMEREIQWDEDVWLLWCDIDEARKAYWHQVEEFCHDCGMTLDHVVHCFTSHSNYRRTIFPEYKGNRVGKRKPLGLKALRAEILALPNSYINEELEADDAISVLAGEARAESERCVVVSGDKDLLQIPGIHYRPWGKSGPEILEVSESEAWRRFWLQVLEGDSVDNIPGCKGVGPVKASKVLEDIEDMDTAAAWAATLKTYCKAGLTEHDAMLTANLVRLLVAADISPQGHVLPWQPPAISPTSKPAPSLSRSPVSTGTP